MEESPSRRAEQPVPVRHVRFEYPDDFRAAWQPLKPEFAAACNALSLGMPYGEPYVVSSIRKVLDDLDDPQLTERVRSYLAQEREHYRQHRRLNELLRAQRPSLARVEKWLAWSYRWLARRGSRKFSVAFAAGFEAVAFASARWMDSHRRELFDGADPVASTLFLWHLAEEVEHKTVAFDVWERVDGRRLRYCAAMATSFLLLVWFIFVGTVFQLTATKRIFNPVAWVRLIKWAISFAFEVIPTMVITALPGHHPRELADPTWMVTWLARYDPTTETIPQWNAPIDAGFGELSSLAGRHHV
jgi:hypothetical protein